MVPSLGPAALLLCSFIVGVVNAVVVIPRDGQTGKFSAAVENPALAAVDISADGVVGGAPQAQSQRTPASTYPPNSPRAGQPVLPIIELDVDSVHVRSEAEAVLKHLKGMSDSGVYQTLTLKRVLFAASHVGVYHNNTMMRVELASPALMDERGVSEHEVVMMTDLEPPHGRAFTIDEFPLMREEAVEEHWRAKVMRSRAAREEAFALMEQEAELSSCTQ